MAYIQKEVRHLLGKAIHQYNMIANGERILVGISGGKDSVSLLWLLHERLKRIPITYDIFPVYVDLGFPENNRQGVRYFLDRFPYEYKIVSTDIGLRAHGPENRENPCFLCSRLRKKLFFNLAKEHGCSKIAFGHHLDDLIETFFLNLFYGAQISTMVPYQEFFGGEMTVIRPLCLVDGEKLEKLCRIEGLPVLKNPCPSSDKGKRQQIREMLQGFYRENRKVRGNIFHALGNVNMDYLPVLKK